MRVGAFVVAAALLAYWGLLALAWTRPGPIPGDIVGVEVVVVLLSMALGALVPAPRTLLAPLPVFVGLTVAAVAAGPRGGGGITAAEFVVLVVLFGLAPASGGILAGIGLRALAERGRRERRVALALPVVVDATRATSTADARRCRSTRATATRPGGRPRR